MVSNRELRLVVNKRWSQLTVKYGDNDQWEITIVSNVFEIGSSDWILDDNCFWTRCLSMMAWPGPKWFNKHWTKAVRDFAGSLNLFNSQHIRLSTTLCWCAGENNASHLNTPQPTATKEFVSWLRRSVARLILGPPAKWIAGLPPAVASETQVSSMIATLRWITWSPQMFGHMIQLGRVASVRFQMSFLSKACQSRT